MHFISFVYQVDHVPRGGLEAGSTCSRYANQEVTFGDSSDSGEDRSGDLRRNLL